MYYFPPITNVLILIHGDLIVKSWKVNGNGSEKTVQ